jgi:N-acetyl-anhydromuramyl-L-alanine amidase AmpD
MREIDEIFIHCSATPPSMDIGVETIRTWHLARNFRDIGYHWVIRRDGVVESGRHPNESGAHVRGRNANSLGVCLVGGSEEETGHHEFNYTMAQMETLEMLVKQILKDLEELQEDVPKIRGHNEVSAKACPCFNVEAWYYG